MIGFAIGLRRGVNVENADWLHDRPRRGAFGLADLMGARPACAVRAEAERCAAGQRRNDRQSTPTSADLHGFAPARG